MTMRSIPALVIAALMAASCGPKAATPASAPEAEASKPDPAAPEKQKQAEQKAAFDPVASDEAKVDELADAGNGFALFQRGKTRIASTEYYVQQGGFEDIEAASKVGNADAQLWVGQRMAYGLEGYQLKPNSGLLMMIKAAEQDNIEAILAVGLMYEQDTFMRDMDKAKTWYQRGVDLGSDKAKDALARLGSPQGL
jgi:TPR repeat protein